MKLLNKTLLITGASGGIGTQTAQLLAKQGCTLILVGRNKTVLNKLLVELNKASEQQHKAVAADLGTRQGREAVVQHAPKTDGLINLAGVNQLAMFENMSDTEITHIISSNLTAPMLLTRDFIPHLASRDEAVILNVGSILGSIGIPGSIAYCASKFGLRGFSEALKRELADTSIKVSYVAPRATATKMNDGAISSLNDKLGNNTDTPDVVALAIVNALQSKYAVNRYLGWPEKLFVRINALFPNLVDGSLIKQLAIIKKYAKKTRRLSENEKRSEIIDF